MGEGASKLASAAGGALKGKEAQAVKKDESLLYKLFKQYDTDGNGTISIDEAVAVLTKLIPGFPEPNMRNLVKSADTNSDNKMGYGEISKFFATIKNKFGGAAKAKEATDAGEGTEADGTEAEGTKGTKGGFGIKDFLNPGKMTYDGLVTLLTEKYGLNGTMAKMLVSMCDKNSDGELDTKEFGGLLSKLTNWQK